MNRVVSRGPWRPPEGAPRTGGLRRDPTDKPLEVWAYEAVREEAGHA